MTTKPFSILHISDLHRSPGAPISNGELISALVKDRDRYIHEDPSIAVPEAIVVSGDIIQGIPLNTDNFATELNEQYEVAEEFLDELVGRFLEGDRSRLIMVPGNHDVDWNTARSALESIEVKDIPTDLRAKLYAKDAIFRWAWKTRTLYRIADPKLYEKRMNAFWTFFDRFYEGVSGLLAGQNPSDVRLFSLCNDRIGVAAYSSRHGNDCFAFHGMIRRESVARSYLDQNDSGKMYDLRMAVWHHSIEGSPYRTDYMDVDVVRGMIGRGFRLGLHGHQHRAQVTPQKICLPDRETMAVVSAGSLCAGVEELPMGTPCQYNVLEIAEDFCRVRVHVRAMIVANLFSRGQFTELGGASFAELSWTPPRNAVGAVINTQARRRRELIDEAEVAARGGVHLWKLSLSLAH
ncbi:MAG: hypothetical protein F4201_06640 [Nitrospira sp. SB0677_bin_15]|nr:hypothetical protein [Nitrospira sp. SB0677_bin_15]